MNYDKIPSLTTAPPEGFGAAFDYNYSRWYFFPLEYKGDHVDCSWVLSEKEQEAVRRIQNLRTFEEWGLADAPFENGLGTSAFTEFIVWMIEMNILNDDTADLIGKNALVNQTRSMMNIHTHAGEASWEYTPWKSWEEETCPPTPKKTFPNERVMNDSVQRNLENEFNEKDYLRGIREKMNDEDDLSAILNYENVSDTSSSEE